MADRTVSCWGADAFGQVGDGHVTSTVPIPTPVQGLTDVKSVAAGGGFTCALKTGGTVVCWGVNTFCELGNGCAGGDLPGREREAINDPVPIEVPGLSGAIGAIAAGRRIGGVGGYVCALLDAGTVECWGSNDLRIDPAPTSAVVAPTLVAGLENVVAIALGEGFACVLLADATVNCWGDGPLGQPDKVLSSSSVPIPVSGLSDVVGIAAGDLHACALLKQGTVACWGANVGGGLGNGTLMDSPVPVMVVDLAGAVAIGAGSYNTCALLSDQTVKCWGFDSAAAKPISVPGLAAALSISTSQDSACAIVGDSGRISCWGDDSSGQLGSGVNIPGVGGGPYSKTPVTVVSGP